MRAAVLLCWKFILFIGLSSSAALAQMALDAIDAPFPSAAEDMVGEHFPLAEAPELGSDQPLRSEPPTFKNELLWNQLREKVLNDFGNRIAPEFHIQSGLRQRTEFWFDIYARYGEAFHIIHHVRHPWIIYRVVDTTELLRTGKGPLWLRRDRGNKLARKQLAEIRAALIKLSKRSSYTNLSGLEKEMYDKLIPVNGPRKKVFREAAQQVRSQLGQRDFFQSGLVNSSKYLPYMEEEFRRRNLPVELTRMPFVESSFNEEARSKVGASGIWQIMPRTGKAYMIVNDHIDERNSPLKATATAARLLRSYFRALDSWPLTITSYNHGIGNIQKAVRAARSRDLAEIIARYHQGDFRFASSNFFTCFLAALYAEKYNELIFKDVPREPLQEYEPLQLTGRTGVKQLQRMTGMTSTELLRYNLDIKSALRGNALLPRGFELHLPPGLKERLRQTSAPPAKSKAKSTAIASG